VLDRAEKPKGLIPFIVVKDIINISGLKYLSILTNTIKKTAETVLALSSFD